MSNASLLDILAKRVLQYGATQLGVTQEQYDALIDELRRTPYKAQVREPQNGPKFMGIPVVIMEVKNG
jgi:hypothetical protein